jgi:hypothetical protein
VTDIIHRTLNTARSAKVTVDIVVGLPSGNYHVSRLTYTGKGLYNVPLTCKSPTCPIDVHDTYHPNGEIHGKLTRGKLSSHPGGQVVGEAQPHTTNREYVLWERRGKPWGCLTGVQRLGQLMEGCSRFTNIETMAGGYPIFSASDADYVFELDRSSLPSEMVDIAFYLCAPHSEQDLGEEMEREMHQSAAPWEVAPPRVTVERAELLTDLTPWLAIVVYCKQGAS